MSNLKDKEYHVVPMGSKWGIRRGDRHTCETIVRTQTTAIDIGRELAKHKNGILVIHNHNGKIRDSIDYSVTSL